MHEHLEERGDYRLERRWQPEENGDHHWIVYARVAVKDGKHPVIRDEKNEPIETTETHVWVPVFAGPEAESRVQFETLQKRTS